MNQTKRLKRSRKAPEPHEILALAKRTGFPIPQSYVEFMKENNGGIPEAVKEVPIQVVYPISSAVEPNVLQQSSFFSPAPHLIVIARTLPGDILLLDTSSGAVLIMESGKLRHLYTDFSALVRSLEPTIDAPDRLTTIAESGDIEAMQHYISSGHSIEERSVSGYTLVEMAALRGDIGFVEACVRLGASTSSLPELLSSVADFELLEILESKGLIDVFPR